MIRFLGAGLIIVAIAVGVVGGYVFGLSNNTVVESVKVINAHKPVYVTIPEVKRPAMFKVGTRVVGYAGYDVVPVGFVIREVQGDWIRDDKDMWYRTTAWLSWGEASGGFSLMPGLVIRRDANGNTYKTKIRLFE